MKPLRLKTSFPFETVLSEASVKTNRMATTKRKALEFNFKVLYLVNILKP